MLENAWLNLDFHPDCAVVHRNKMNCSCTEKFVKRFVALRKKSDVGILL
jgi:hypothetical protein